MRSSGIRAISIQKPFPTFAVSVSGGGAMIPVYSKERRHLSLLETKRLIFLFLAQLIKQLSHAVCPAVIGTLPMVVSVIMRNPPKGVFKSFTWHQ